MLPTRLSTTGAVLSGLLFTLSSLTADVRITEVMTANIDTHLDEDGDSPDWIELHNDGDTPVNLGGYFLSDNPDDLNTWELPAVELAAGGYLVIFASDKDRRQVGANLHTNFQLKNGGEFLALVSPDKTTITDAYDPEVPQLDEGESYGVQLKSGNWVVHFFDTPTPGAENTGGTVAEEVMFSVTGQPFVDTMELELSSRSGSDITYTSDGKRPTLFNGKKYSGPISIDETTIITASISGGPFRQEVYAQVTPGLADFTSNLPLVFVRSESVISTNANEVPALFGVLEAAEGAERTALDHPFQTTSRGWIHRRGSSTRGFPKPSYRIEFQNAAEEDRVLKPLGLPAESDWILSGRYEEDRSLIRNEFTYALSNQIGRYAARTKFIEVYINTGDGPFTEDDYVGVYSFMETLKRDADRIDIDELLPEHNAEPEITGGYIFKVDRSGDTETVVTGGGQRIAINEPARIPLTTEQRDYLVGYLNDMQDSLTSSDPETGYPAFIDVPSWIDHHMINTLMLNVDSLRLSTYFYKERSGKVFGGPVWDFNISSGSRDRFGNPPRPRDPDVWRGISGDRGTTFFENGTQRWWGTLFDQRDFQQDYCDRWHELRAGAFSTENIHALIDSLADEIREAQVRNEARWSQVPPEYGGWQGEIDHFKDWLERRGEFMDEELVRPPAVTPAGGALADGEMITMKGNRGTLFNRTTVYYTTDGTDPRLPGGGINPDATAYSSPFRPDASVNIVAREHLPNYNPEPDGPDQEWSAPQRLQIVVGTPAAAAGNVVISELMYHPANPTTEEEAAGFMNDDSFEYVEFANISGATIDLLGVQFTDGIEFTFEESVLVPAGGYAVIVANAEAFAERYGDAIPIAGVYSGNLRNSGESVAIQSASGEPILGFTYNDNDPWPDEADGDGVSLVLNNPAGNPDANDVASWVVSPEANGSPGSAGGDIVVPEGLTYEEWADATFAANPAQSGKTMNPDNDDRVNLIEFALLGDPLVNDHSNITVARDGDAIVVTFLQRKDIEGTTVALESSADLNTWAAANPTSDETSDAGEDAEQRTLRFNADSAEYVRVKVE